MERTDLEKDLAVLAQPSAVRWLARVAVDWLMVVGALIAFSWAMTWEHPARWLALPVVLLVIGAAQHRLGLMGHDGVPHGCVSRTRWVNDLLTGLFAFWPLCFSLGGYRRFHLAHHDTVGTEADPEWAGHKSLPVLGQWRLPWSPRKYGLHVLGDLVGGGIPHIITAARLTGPRSFKDAIGPILTVSSAIGLCLWTGLWWVPVLWFGSLYTTFWALFRTRLWLEHAGLELVGPDSDPTYRVAVPWWLRWAICPHNGDCHWEHHYTWDNPTGRRRWAVPVWNLRKARTLLLEHGIGPPEIGLRELCRKLRQTPNAPPQPTEECESLVGSA